MSGINGSKNPAPVLPGLGLHSFHYDSPPFAAASASELPLESAGFQLDSSRTSSSSSNTSSQRVNGQYSGSIPIPQRGFVPLSAAVSGSHGPPLASPLQEDDEALSTSRSRRLVSGYIFGNPPSPDNSMSNQTTSARQPTPPAHDISQGRDSPPLSEVATSHSSPAQTGTTLHSMARLSMRDHPTMPSSAETSRPPRGARLRRDSTYDALSGLRDGEADLDERANLAPSSTVEYLSPNGGNSSKYRFPRHRLRRTMKDESKIPLVIVACGSFSPPTYLHLRMFEMAKDEIVESQTFEIMGGYYSPVSSHYKKAGLAPAVHRVRMCELAVEHTSTWLMVDPWEAGQPEYQRTAVVLDHFDAMLNGEGGGLMMGDGKKRRYKIMLLAGGDLIESFGEPGIWSEPDLHIILGRFGCLIVERAGSDVWAFLLSHDILYHHRRNVIVIKQLIYNDISSTKVRLFVRRAMSIKYLLPNSVIQYIYDNKLYREPDYKAITN